MPCVTQDQSGAWDIFREGRDGGGRRAAAKAVAKPSGVWHGSKVVHLLFHATVVFAVLFGVSCLGKPLSLSEVSRIELSARIVIKADGRWLGNMAKAVTPLAEDGSYVPPARVT